MDHLIRWLSERKLFTIAFILAYSIAVILLHKQVNECFDWLRTKLTFRIYDTVLLYVGIIITVVFIILLFKKIINGKQKQQKLLFMLFTIFLMIIAHRMMMVFSIELIHYPQYLIPAIPIFALVRRFDETIYWTTFIGAIDEANQYFVLYRDNNTVYLDYNDMLMNLVGAGIGVFLVYALSDENEFLKFHVRHIKKWRKAIIWSITGLILLSGAVLYMTGMMRFYPGADVSGATILLSRIPESTQFWTITKYGKPFHILNWCEGLFFAAISILSYSLIDRNLHSERSDQ